MSLPIGSASSTSRKGLFDYTRQFVLHTRRPTDRPRTAFSCAFSEGCHSPGPVRTRTHTGAASVSFSIDNDSNIDHGGICGGGEPLDSRHCRSDRRIPAAHYRYGHRGACSRRYSGQWLAGDRTVLLDSWDSGEKYPPSPAGCQRRVMEGGSVARAIGVGQELLNASRRPQRSWIGPPSTVRPNRPRAYHRATVPLRYLVCALWRYAQSFLHPSSQSALGNAEVVLSDRNTLIAEGR